LKPWQQQQWCIPKVDYEFIARMEDILDLYASEPDPAYPLVCFDERPTQLIDHVVEPLPTQPGQPARYDYHYRRNGTCNLFMSFAPQIGWRHVQVSAQRCIPDFARQMRWLVDVAFPQATKIRIVLDNLNTHKISSLYKTFPPDEARRIARKLELHFTPVHASWLNMAEIEWSVLVKQCLARRIPTKSHLGREIAFWETRRNVQKATVEWTFTCAKARETMGRLYPS